jgi:imidazolonepropionase
MLAIRNIGELALVGPGPVAGRSMRNLTLLHDAAIMIDHERIVWYGDEAAFMAPADCEEIDAEGCCVTPGLIDCHTHTVFAGTREDEFVQRLQGRTYEQIAQAGGGIRVTVDAVRRASVEELVELALPRLRHMLANGVTTVEIKSGYGLTVDDEIKMLEAVARLGKLQPIELVPTYLAAHTTPREFAGRADEYLATVFADGVLSRISRLGLAEFCDVFCERTAFDVRQSRHVLAKAKEFGLLPKLHVDQLSQMGASRLAAEVRAISADHLEMIDDPGIEALKEAGTIAVLLPGSAFFLGVAQAPARRIIDADVPVAIATDYNPGSSMIESLPLVMNIACTQVRMTPAEVLVAATANAAAALDRQDRLGAIETGMQADLVILDVLNHQRWCYEPGRNCVRIVLKRGKVVYARDDVAARSPE